MKANKEEFNDKLYRMRVYPIDNNVDEVEWVAEYPDLPGCVGAGDTIEEAVSMAVDAKKAWLNAAIEQGKSIPEPINLYESRYSGKFTLRLPKTLHRELALKAEDEGVSLNQYILYLISKEFSKEITETTLTDKEIYKLKIETKMTASESTIEQWKRSPFNASLDSFVPINRR